MTLFGVVGRGVMRDAVRTIFGVERDITELCVSFLVLEMLIMTSSEREFSQSTGTMQMDGWMDG